MFCSDTYWTGENSFGTGNTTERSSVYSWGDDVCINTLICYILIPTLLTYAYGRSLIIKQADKFVRCFRQLNKCCLKVFCLEAHHCNRNAGSGCHHFLISEFLENKYESNLLKPQLVLMACLPRIFVKITRANLMI